MQRRTHLGVSLAPVFALVLVAGALPAGAQRVAEVEVGLTAIDFRPNVAYEKAVLTLAGPAEVSIRREFDAGASISLALFDQHGSRLPDGAYKYELRFQPKLDAETRAQLAAARDSGDTSIVEKLRREGRIPAPMLERGSFSLQGGVALDPGMSEPRPAARGGAQLAPRTTFTDSLCVGFDCPVSPSFSDTTILMMENSTRIKFDDTSVAPFPLNDWEIEANEAASGGVSHLAIHDCGTSSEGGCATDPVFGVEAGARTRALWVESDGDVGLGTNSPVLDLHIVTGNTPAMRLEQDGSSGFTAQTWDVGGNEANFFVRDVTGGSRLPFRIQPGAPSNSLFVDSVGDIGVGTAGPATSVDIVRSGTIAAEVQATTFSNDGNFFSNMVLRRALGTSGVPLAVTSNSILGTFSFRGHTGTAFATENNARLEVRAEENFTTTAQGTRMIFQTTANGTTTPSTRMVIKNDGAVGIGTANPTVGSRLEVSGGSIRVTGGSFIDDGTTLNVPDYVFEPEYELRSLGELEAFITTHKHLPGVPSRDEVKENGLNLSDFQMRLLEKVEELTLYTLRQDQRIADLEARLAAMQEGNPR